MEIDNFALQYALDTFYFLICGALVMWMAELVTERGIGNGMSLLIMAGIASRIPKGLASPKWPVM